MAIVSSYGTLTAIANPQPSALASLQNTGSSFYDGYRHTYGEIYRRQPAVRTVVDFFSRNIAQLGIGVFHRIGDADRVRLFDHGLAQTLRRPNPATTRYRFIENTVQDIGIYANGFWLKVRTARRLGLVRVPAAEMKVAGGLLPTGYVWEPGAGSKPQTFAPSEIVHFRMYDPLNPLVGFPPIETLRRILAEEHAAGQYRQQFWKNGARVESVIERPVNAPKWEPDQRADFRRSWQEFTANGAKGGMTPVLEHGMTLRSISQNFRDSEYISARKLTREEVAAEYHVPLPMVGILDHATFSNIREQHKQLYQDCLGPWLTMLEEDIELQALPEFEVDAESGRVYVEFNIAEKLKGSFEEQAQSLATAVGRPYMTGNEARARLNLPRHTNPTMDDVADTAPGQGQAFSQRPRQDGAALRAVLTTFAARQGARLSKAQPEDLATSYDHARWCRELSADLTPLLGADRAGEHAGVITNETYALVLDGQEPWSAARVEQLVDRLSESLNG